MRRFLSLECCALTLGMLAIFDDGNLSAADPNSADYAASKYSRVTVRSTELREFDWAKLQAHAHVAYVSSGPRMLTGRMIDNDLRTVFRFRASDDSPTVIVELAHDAQLHRVSAVFKAEEARVDVYLLNKLPKDPRDLRFLAPMVTILDPPQDRGVATVDFPANSARYVALRWIRRTSSEPFEVAEISAFSSEPTDLSLDQDVHLASNNGSNLTGTEPPQVPVVSP